MGSLPKLNLKLKYILTVADPDLQIRGEGPVGFQTFFRPFGPQFRLNIRGALP